MCQSHRSGACLSGASLSRGTSWGLRCGSTFGSGGIISGSCTFGSVSMISSQSYRLLSRTKTPEIHWGARTVSPVSRSTNARTWPERVRPSLTARPRTSRATSSVTSLDQPSAVLNATIRKGSLY